MKTFTNFCIFFLVCISASVLGWQLTELFKKQKQIPYFYSHQSTTCKTAEQSACGIYLKDCANGKTYTCLKELTIVRAEK